MSVNGAGERLALIDAVIYGDAFDCAVNEAELWRYSRRRCEPADLRAQIEADPALRGLLRESGGLWCLADREALIGLRRERAERSRRLSRRARRVARALRHTPFVRGLLLTGSVAAGNASEQADVDLLVIVEPGRLSLAFMALAPVSRLLSRRLFCPNLYISSAAMRLGRRDLYVAREIAQAVPLAGAATELAVANAWVAELLPNALPTGEPLPGGGRLQRLLEAPLRGRFGEWVERRLQSVVLARLRAHHGTRSEPVPETVRTAFEAGAELRFHAVPVREQALGRYERRRSEIAAKL